jgi:hypothetical protein
MPNRRKSILAAALGLAVLLGGVFLGRTLVDGSSKSFLAKDVWTYNCEFEDQKPDMLFETCADGNWGIEKIKWATWKSGIAEGQGIYFRNTCLPSCVDGKFENWPVNVSLDTPVVKGKRQFLTSLNYFEIDKSGKTLKGGISGGWDVSEMYRNMKG